MLRVGQPVSATEPVVLLHDPGADPRRSENDVAYVGASSIESVTVHDAVSLAPKLPAPSKLQLSRRLHGVQEQLAQPPAPRSSSRSSGPPASRKRGCALLGSLVDEVEAALSEVVSDSMALEAIKATLRSGTALTWRSVHRGCRTLGALALSIHFRAWKMNRLH